MFMHARDIMTLSWRQSNITHLVYLNMNLNLRQSSTFYSFNRSSRRNAISFTFW